MNKPHIVVIGGGANPEHEISLASAAGIAQALTVQNYPVSTLTIERDGSWSGPNATSITLAQAVEIIAKSDLVFPAVHGPHGEDGTLAALCDLAGKPCVGSSLTAGAIGMDKWASKLVAQAVAVPTARGRLLTADEISATDGSQTTLADLSLPLVIKPVAAGSSHGVNIVTNVSEYEHALSQALAIDQKILVEEYVPGREIDIAIFERADGTLTVSPPLEIAQRPAGIFDLTTKYDGSACFVVPAALTETQTEKLHQAARDIYRAMGCSGVARVDFFVTDDEVIFNEINTMPGFTEHSQVPVMYQSIGIDYRELVALLVTETLARHDANSGNVLASVDQ